MLSNSKSGGKTASRFRYRYIILFAFFAAIGLVFRFMITGGDFIGYALLLIALLILVSALLKHFSMHKTLLAMSIITVLGAVFFIILEAIVIAGSLSSKNPGTEYLIVLGAGVDGNTPSVSLQNRLSAAFEYMRENPDSVAIVSGGKGPGENITEAEAMRIWLEGRGIAPGRIIKEERAASTKENLIFSFEIIKNRGGGIADGVTIVSSEYHLCRAKLMARQLGAVPYGVPARTTILHLKINYFIREAFAVLYTWLFG